MNRDARIFVAGHNGLVGSAIMRKLVRERYEQIITRTRNQLDLTNFRKVDEFFRQQLPDYVFMAAARVGGIRINNQQRVHFILDNLSIQNNIISCAFKYKVKKLLFLGSSCIYPRDCPQPIREDMLLTGPLENTNEPYAIAKIAGLKLCESYNRQFDTDYITLMPSNLYGPGDNYDLNTSHVLAALIKKMVIAKSLAEDNLQLAIKLSGQIDVKALKQFTEAHGISAEYITVWGSGKARREFLYVDDLADACIFTLKHLDWRTLGSTSFRSHFNAGYGTDLSIAELVMLIKDLVGFDGDIRYDVSQPDGTPQKLLDSSGLRTLGWKPETDLVEGIQHTIKQDFGY